MAEYIAVEREAVHKTPDHVLFEIAALVEPLAVGRHPVKMAKPEPGGCCLMLGAGRRCGAAHRPMARILPPFPCRWNKLRFFIRANVLWFLYRRNRPDQTRRHPCTAGASDQEHHSPGAIGPSYTAGSTDRIGTCRLTKEGRIRVVLHLSSLSPANVRHCLCNCPMSH